MKYGPNSKEKGKKSENGNKNRWRLKESYRWSDEYYDDYYKDNDDDDDDYYDDEEDYKDYLEDENN